MLHANRSEKPRRRGPLTCLGGMLLAAVLATQAPAGEPKGDAGPFKMVPRDGTAFVTVRVADVWNSKGLAKIRAAYGEQVAAEFKKTSGLAIDDIERITFVLAEKEWPEEKGRNWQPEMWVVVQTRVAVTREALLGVLMGKAVEEKAGGKTYFQVPGAAFYLAGEKEIWMAPGRELPALLEGSRKIAMEGPLAEALTAAAASKHHLVAGFQFPAKLKQLALKNKKGMPPEMAPLMEIQSGMVTLDLGAGGLLEARVKFAKAETASQVVDLSLKFLAKSREVMAKFQDDPKLKKVDLGPIDLAEVRKTLGEIKLEAKGTELRVTAPGLAGTMAVGAALLIPAVQKVEEARERIIATNNLRQLLIAMHNYHDVRKMFPPARLNKGLSWRVAILPYIEELPLYNEFKQDEPWDSPHNIKLLKRMPKIYAPVGERPAPEGHTCWQVVVGDKLLFHPTMDLKANLVRIRDGASNTLLIVESNKLVPWTKPADIEYQPFAGKGRPALGFQVPGQFLAGFADASVRLLPTDLMQDLLDGIIDPSDEKVIELP